MLTIFSGNLRALDFNLLRVQNDVLGGLGDFGGYFQIALVAPRAAKLQVVKRYMIMERFDPKALSDSAVACPSKSFPPAVERFSLTRPGEFLCRW